MVIGIMILLINTIFIIFIFARLDGAIIRTVYGALVVNIGDLWYTITYITCAYVSILSILFVHVCCMCFVYFGVRIV